MGETYFIFPSYFLLLCVYGVTFEHLGSALNSYLRKSISSPSLIFQNSKQPKKKLKKTEYVPINFISMHNQKR